MNDEYERVKMSGREYYALRALIGVVSTFSAYDADIEKRVRMIPNGWRDLKLIEAKADKLFAEIMKTVPLQKIQQMKKELNNVRVEVNVIPDYTGRKKDCFTYVPQDALEWLEEQVISMECAFCEKTCEQSKKCPIRKNIEALYHYDFPEKVGCPLAQFKIEGDE